MLTSLAATTPAQLEGWQSSVTTTGGQINSYDNYSTSTTFQATLTGTVPPPILARTGVFSHIAAGGGWTTVITLRKPFINGGSGDSRFSQ